MNALSRAPDVYLLHPNPERSAEADFCSLVPEPASAAHLAWLDEDEAPYDDVAIVFSELGVSSTTSTGRCGFHLELPPDAPPDLDLLAGRVTGIRWRGREQLRNRSDTSISGQYGSAYHLAFPLDGRFVHTVEIVGASGW